MGIPGFLASFPQNPARSWAIRPVRIEVRRKICPARNQSAFLSGPIKGKAIPWPAPSKKLGQDVDKTAEKGSVLVTQAERRKRLND